VATRQQRLGLAAALQSSASNGAPFMSSKLGLVGCFAPDIIPVRRLAANPIDPPWINKSDLPDPDTVAHLTKDSMPTPGASNNFGEVFILV
jgi:hypothetical protein